MKLRGSEGEHLGSGIPDLGCGHCKRDWEKGRNSQPLEATPGMCEGKVSFQGSSINAPRQVKHHEERYPLSRALGLKVINGYSILHPVLNIYES